MESVLEVAQPEGWQNLHHFQELGFGMNVALVQNYLHSNNGSIIS